ncbi:Resolvase, N terminal domain [Dyadobacter soli]|uniref:Resolvase, N terminal domain n=1 Tax=Dyadobacter soli TaxID=659014 RepID=A0A1G8CIJ0_9BACT|nr:Resolvase, N terminal domain [Dyadobacter soli]
MIFGYARVSTQDQNLNLQIDDLKKSGCERIFREKVSSVKERPELNKLLDSVREGHYHCLEARQARPVAERSNPFDQ